MIDASTVQQLATRYRTTALNVAREYCQHLLLSHWYQQPRSERILFKGGTALRIIYGSPRFSEDLDFSGFHVSTAEIEALLTYTLSTIERVGLALRIEEAKATTGGYLGILHCRWLDYMVEIRLEISLRSRSVPHAATALIAGDLLPAYTLLHLPQELLVAEKLRALLDRGRPRDVYDCYFLLRKGLLTPQSRRLLPQVLKRLQQMPGAAFNELKVFLPSDQHRLLKDFRGTIQREFSRYLR